MFRYHRYLQILMLFVLASTIFPVTNARALSRYLYGLSNDGQVFSIDPSTAHVTFRLSIHTTQVDYTALLYSSPYFYAIYDIYPNPGDVQLPTQDLTRFGLSSGSVSFMGPILNNGGVESCARG